MKIFTKKIWVLLIFLIIVGVALLFAVKHPRPTATFISTTTPTPTAAPIFNAIVITKTQPNGTFYLTDSTGRTLYVFGGSGDGTSACTGTCLSAWPIYAGSSGDSLPSSFSLITRGDGKNQYAYKGKALYYFTADATPGVINGDGIANFHVAQP